MSLETHRLVLEPLDRTAWRLCDRAVAASDPHSIVAYVEEQDDGRYAVTWVAPGFAAGTYATIGALLRDAAHLLRERAQSSATKPVPIPHRPPLATR